MLKKIEGGWVTRGGSNMGPLFLSASEITRRLQSTDLHPGFFPDLEMCKERAEAHRNTVSVSDVLVKLRNLCEAKEGHPNALPHRVFQAAWAHTDNPIVVDYLVDHKLAVPHPAGGVRMAGRDTFYPCKVLWARNLCLYCLQDTPPTYRLVKGQDPHMGRAGATCPRCKEIVGKSAIFTFEPSGRPALVPIDDLGNPVPKTWALRFGSKRIEHDRTELVRKGKRVAGYVHMRLFGEAFR